MGWLGSKCAIPALLVLSGVIALVLAALWAGPAQAQEPGPGWSKPIMLSVDAPPLPGHAGNPRIVAAADGTVHVFWDGITSYGPNAYPNVVYYTRWSGNSWSKPVDIFYGGQQRTELPFVAIDSQGIMHAVWTGGYGDRLKYSHVLVSQAGAARAWSSEVIANGNGISGNLAVDPSGDVFVVYSLGDGLELHFMRLSHETGLWSPPAAIPGTRDQEGITVAVNAIAVDGNGTIHVTWTDTIGDKMFSGRAFYARSTDGGQHWSAPLQLDPDRGQTYGVDTVNIQVVGKNEIHLFWLADALRRHQWSKDGGLTWTQPESFFGGLFGHNGIDQTFLDSAGVLHVVGAGHGPLGIGTDSIFHTTWTGSGWTAPELVMLGPDSPDRYRVIDYPWAAISSGNRIHVVVHDHQNIWYTSKTIDAPALPTAPIPTPAPSRTLAATPTVPVATATSATPTQPRHVLTGDVGEPLGNPTGPTSLTLLLAAVPSALLVGLVLLVRFRHTS